MQKLVLLAFALVAFISCTAQPAKKENPTHSTASSDATKLIETIDQQLKSGKLTITDALTDHQYMHLHSLSLFRDVIKRNAKTGLIRLTHEDEPGLHILVKGNVRDINGPVRNALIYVYQTSDKGWYADTSAHVNMMEGDMRHARLFGYLKTDDKGDFQFETIRPRGYPRSDLPAHIHLHMWDAHGEPIHGVPGELLFEEDDRLTPARRKEAAESRYLIASNSGTSDRFVYEYKIVVE